MLPGKILKLYVAKHAISCILASSVTVKELFTTIKVDVARSAVSPFRILLLLETS